MSILIGFLHSETCDLHGGSVTGLDFGLSKHISPAITKDGKKSSKSKHLNISGITGSSLFMLYLNN